MRLPCLPVVLGLLAFAACSTTVDESVTFTAGPNQKITYVPGEHVIIESRGPTSVVSLHPPFKPKAGFKVAYIVTIENTSRQSQPFHMADIQVLQVADGKTQPLKVFAREELVQEATTSLNRSEALLKGLMLFAAYDDGDPDGSIREQRVAQSMEERRRSISASNQVLLRDYTLGPKGKYAGILVIDSPAANKLGQKIYAITLKVGSDEHEFLITQAKSTD